MFLSKEVFSLEMESNSKPLAVLLESQSEADNLYLLGRAPGDE